MNPPTDYLGREIKVGDTLVYPVRRGSSMWLNQIAVRKVEPNVVIGVNSTGRVINIKNLGNTVAIPATEPAD